eukprot:12806759-Heterocapsa_arctica.AAC.1
MRPGCTAASVDEGLDLRSSPPPEYVLFGIGHQFGALADPACRSPGSARIVPRCQRSTAPCIRSARSIATAFHG